MKKVLITGNVKQEGLDILEPFAEIVTLSEPIDQEALAHHLCNVDAVLHKMGRIDAKTLKGQTKLKLIARHGVGLDLLDLDYIHSQGIQVTTTPGVNSNAVAELAVAMMINLIRQAFPARDSLRINKIWTREAFTGLDLRDQTVGLIGLGQIGARVSELLGVFGSHVLVYDPFIAEAKKDMKLVGLQELLKASDIISFHCPLTPETKDLINPDNISMLKDGVFLVNTARGGLVDEDFLALHVKSGKVAGVAIDATVSEPPDYEHELFSLANVIVTPHIGAMSQSAQVGMVIGAAREIERVLRFNDPPRCLVS